MEAYNVFKSLAIIIVSAKLMGLLAKKVNVPQVVGEILAGLLIGPSVLGLVEQTDFLSQMAEIGVILLMFSAGLGTNLHNLIKTGPKAFLIACLGVAFPLVTGSILSMCFNGFAPIGSQEFYKNVFIGVILTATSVSITVKALEEMGKLKSLLGTTIVSAAIIDDVIGIIVLTIVIGLGGGDAKISTVVIKSLLFFAFSGLIGFAMYKIFKLLNKYYSHQQRLPILSLAMCFALSYIAEKFFGVADITGAFVAGIMLCNLHDANYIERKMNINSYMLFGPVFFAGIGLKTDLGTVDGTILLFAACFIVVALLSKIIGCGFAAKITGSNWSDSLKVGIGMMTRGEVALVVTQKGLSAGLISPAYFTPVILLIIISSVLTPIFLQLIYNKDDKLTTLKTTN